MTTIPGSSRPLTPGEVNLTHAMFGDAIDVAAVEVRRRKWIFFQPRHVVMAPSGHLHLHPQSTLWSEDFSRESLAVRGLFLHEMTHVWQHQRGVYLPLARHPFCRYHYRFTPGWRLPRYGLEQQAEIVRHAYLLREGYDVPGAPPLDQYETLLAFGRG